jgi:hypothetical protein
MSARPTPAQLRLAGRAAQVIRKHGSLRDAELLAILGCELAELNAAIPVVIRWRRADRCGAFLVAVSRQGKGRPSA